jgi:hydrogenase maturation protein HypF
VVRINPTILTQPDSGKSLYPLRRSRGYTPNPIKLKWETAPLLAAGGELKNAFCLTRENYAFISHHIGDMENLETLQAFEDGIRHFENLFRIQPEAIAYDLHPNYMATKYALARVGEEGLPKFGVQHHHAHIASCMAENGLTGEQPVIGLAFDGTGYGEDGNIWGGEVLIADYNGYQRAFHLQNVPLPGGDKAVREPCRQALAWLKQSELAWEENLPPVNFLSEKEQTIINQQIEKGINAPLTSSMGRLFDAVSSLIGVCQKANYEAQAAIELEVIVDPDETNSYPFEINQGIIDPTKMIRAIVSDLLDKTLVETIAARFHNTIAEISREVCIRLREEHDLNQVVLSGGVWQNMVLLSKTVQLLSSTDFEIYMHNLVPANDGGLSLGQAVIAHHRLEGKL